MTVEWQLYDCSSDEVRQLSVGNQGDFKLTALANLLTSRMTFHDLSPANAWLWQLCMTNAKCVILLRVSQEASRCPTLSQAMNALVILLYLPIFGLDIIIQRFEWVMSCFFSLSMRGRCLRMNPVLCWGRPTCLHWQSQWLKCHSSRA